MVAAVDLFMMDVFKCKDWTPEGLTVLAEATKSLVAALADVETALKEYNHIFFWHKSYMGMVLRACSVSVWIPMILIVALIVNHSTVHERRVTRGEHQSRARWCQDSSGELSKLGVVGLLLVHCRV